MNSLFANFRSTSNCDILSKLFVSYCTSFYGSQTWSYTCKEFKEILIAWNKAVRKLWNLPYNSHTDILPHLLKSDHIEQQIHSRFCKMYHTMYISKNDIMGFMAHRALQNSNGTLGSNLIYIARKYNLSFIYFRSKGYFRLKREYDYINEALCITELIKCIKGSSEMLDFSNTEVKLLIDSIAVC